VRSSSVKSRQPGGRVRWAHRYPFPAHLDACSQPAILPCLCVRQALLVCLWTSKESRAQKLTRKPRFAEFAEESAFRLIPSLPWSRRVGLSARRGLGQTRASPEDAKG
jgi:hypothetical protein